MSKFIQDSPELWNEDIHEIDEWKWRIKMKSMNEHEWNENDEWNQNWTRQGWTTDDSINKNNRTNNINPRTEK